MSKLTTAILESKTSPATAERCAAILLYKYIHKAGVCRNTSSRVVRLITSFTDSCSNMEDGCRQCQHDPRTSTCCQGLTRTSCTEEGSISTVETLPKVRRYITAKNQRPRQACRRYLDEHPSLQKLPPSHVDHHMSQQLCTHDATWQR